VSFKQDSELIGFKQVCCSTHQATRVGDEYHTQSEPDMLPIIYD
jgi:hypothetical protein